MIRISTYKPNASEDMIQLFQEAHRLSPKKPGEVDVIEEGPIDNFLKAAELWEKAAKEITKLSDEKVPSFYALPLSEGVYSGDRFNIISLCYASAAKCLLSAQYLEIFKKTNQIGHSVDKQIQELFKKSLLADKLINTTEMTSFGKLRVKERSLLTLRWATGCLRNHENPNLEKIQRVTDKIYRKELKIAHDFEHIVRQKKVEWSDIEWRCLMNSARHYLIVGRLAPTPEKKREILLRGEEIGRKIWFECAKLDPSCFPEFNPDRSDHVEGTVIGMIQRELGHCTSRQFSTVEILAVDIRFEKTPKEKIQLW